MKNPPPPLTIAETTMIENTIFCAVGYIKGILSCFVFRTHEGDFVTSRCMERCLCGKYAKLTKEERE